MIRVVIFLLLIALAAIGEVWLADRPGDVAITWMGHRIETSVMVLAAAVAAVAAATTILWSRYARLFSRIAGAGSGRFRRCGGRAQIHG